jgi:hypothetical protein
LLIANGEHPKRIQALMGHSSIKVTMDVYGHLMPGGGDEVADRLGALVFSASGSRTVALDELELAGEGLDDTQAIVSIGGPGRTRTYDQGIMSIYFAHSGDFRVPLVMLIKAKKPRLSAYSRS